MSTNTVSDLFSRGFSLERCPITQQVLSNMTRSFDGFHVSYARELSHYGCDTTALVLGDRVFFILNGYHADAMVEAAEQQGIHGCVDIFVDRIAHANKLSEHNMAVKMVADPFNLYQTTLDLIGQENVDRIRQAIADEND